MNSWVYSYISKQNFKSVVCDFIFIKFNVCYLVVKLSYSKTKLINVLIIYICVGQINTVDYINLHFHENIVQLFVVFL